MPTVAFTTLGCKVNQYETQAILERFEAAGFQVAPFEGPADVYVINSCSVTSQAEAKSRYTIRRAVRGNPNAKVVVTGCAAQMALNQNEPIAGADLVVPNPEKLETLRHLLESFPEFQHQLRALPAPARTPEVSGRTRATLKIQDGCSVFCSYCSIPFTRPKMVSRPVGEVLDEARRMIALGYREIVLTGVLIGAYGPETGSDGPDFEGLVGLLSDLPGMGRLRISSIEMPQVSNRLVELLQAGRVAPHLHIPLQSGDTGVLRDMNRRYTQTDYLALADRLHRDVPDFSLTTDIMVGFPTESAERFESTLEVCRHAGFLKAHVFRFSPRFGTPADQWGDPVPEAEKARRSKRVTEAAAQTAETHRRRFRGRVMRVLVEGKAGRDGLRQGLTDNYLEVAFPGPAALQRQFTWVRLLEVDGERMVGELASPFRVGLPVLQG